MTIVSPTLVTATSQGHSLLAGLMFNPTSDLAARGGVVAGLELTKTAGMTWSLGTGRGAVQITSSVAGGTPPFAVTAAETGTFDDGDALKDRLDSIIARLDAGTGLIVIEVLKGDLPAAGAPLAKTLPDDAERLWNILIPAGTSVGSGGWLEANRTDVRTWAGIGNDPGDIKFSGRSTAPNGWLIASGQTVSRTIFSELFAAIGTAFGAGDGSTTFGLPDLRGRAPVGVKAGDADFGTLGAAGGAKTHAHPLSAAGHAHISISGSSIFEERLNLGAFPWTYNVRAPSSAEVVASGGVGTGTILGGSTDSTNGLDPYLALTPLIKT